MHDALDRAPSRPLMPDTDPPARPPSIDPTSPVPDGAAHKLRSAINALPTPALILDREGAIVAANEAFNRCFAFPRGRSRGLRLDELAAEGESGGPIRELVRGLAGRRRRLLTSEAWCRRNDGTRLFCRIVASPAVADATGPFFVAAIEERTALRERGDELEARSALMLRVADRIDDALLVVDHELRALHYGNAAVERVLGIGLEALRIAPRSLLSAVHPDDKASVAALLEGASQATQAHVRLSGPSGDLRRLRMDVVRCPEIDRQGRVAVLVRDETGPAETRALADDVARVGSELADALQRLCGRIDRDLSAGPGNASSAQRVEGAFEKRLALLSPRERQVLELLVEGKSTQQICESLELRPSTVGVHRAAIMRKLGVKSSVTLLRKLVFSGAFRRDL